MFVGCTDYAWPHFKLAVTAAIIGNPVVWHAVGIKLPEWAA